MALAALLPLGLRAEPAAKPSSAPPPAEEFFRQQSVSFGQLNPAGTHLAVLVYDAKTDSTGLRIFNLATKQSVSLPGTKSFDVRTFQWAGDERLVLTGSINNLVVSGLYLVHRDLKGPPAVLNERDFVQVLGTPDARPNNLIVWVQREARTDGQPGPVVEIKLREGNDRDRGFDYDPSRVLSSIAPPPCDGVHSWIRDRTGEVRYAIGQTKAELRLFRRETGSGGWTKVDLDLDRNAPLGVDVDPNVLLVARENAAGLYDLVRINTVDGSAGPVLYTDPKYDFSQAILRFAGNNRDLLGLSYNRQGPAQIWFNDSAKAVQAAIDAALPPNCSNLIIGRSKDDSRLLVRSSSDRYPGSLYLFEPKTGALTLIADYFPGLANYRLPSVTTMSFKARDGLMLDGYVTLPPDYAPGKPAPMIVLPHGGPWGARDFWGYEAESAFFASRGYLVFRPNYRGSAGYSAAISVAQRVDFQKMHEDVTDGVRALIKSGIADPQHIAIVGSSFGGYLAVCGAAFEPDLYRCAVTIAGVFDWKRVIADGSRSKPLAYERLNYELSAAGMQEKLEALSPVLSADKIKIPVFIAHGGADSTVAASQSKHLAEKLSARGIPCETMFENWEGHGFAAFKNRVELYQRIESFLKKNL